MASPTKILKQIMKIGTHNGNFHCDEVFACFLLKQMPECATAEIIRSRDPEVLKDCDIVVDVGGVYDKETLRFDHHQRGFTDTLKTVIPSKLFETKLSSAGLVYAHFGRRIFSILLSTNEADEMIDVMFDKMYKCFVEEIDAVDNGIDQCDCSTEPRYLVTSTIGSRVGRLYPLRDVTPESENAAFLTAVKMVGDEFLDRLTYYHTIWWPARNEVQKVINDRFSVCKSGEIIAFPPGVSVPWKDHFFELEKATPITPTVKFALFKESTENGGWRVLALNVRPGTFALRLPLMESWRGLRDQELSKQVGSEGCVFVHTGGFIGGHKNYDGALLMARKSLESK